MGLVLITGSSGTGKSTIRSELANRGYRSFGTDEDGIAVWRNRTTGVIEQAPRRTTGEWLRSYGWELLRSRVEELAKLAEDQLIFLCGSGENETEMWELFTVSICLVLDDATLRERIASRTNNNFGKEPAELAAILSSNSRALTKYRELGAKLIDSSQSIDAIVDEVLATISDPAH